jgi:hypothetical protein
MDRLDLGMYLSDPIVYRIIGSIASGENTFYGVVCAVWDNATFLQGSVDAHRRVDSIINCLQDYRIIYEGDLAKVTTSRSMIESRSFCINPRALSDAIYTCYLIANYHPILERVA